jgi:tripartite-type tricarboxylate transporter receptor subunit TctC
MQHVPYAGSVAAFPDLLSGRVPIMFSVAPPTMAYIKSGKMRALAVTGTKRNPELPDVPTMIEAGIPDFDAVSWFAFFAPAKTPDDVVVKLNADINAALKDPAVAEKFHSLGMTIVGGSPKQLGDLVESENDKWGAVIKEAGLKPLD